MRPIRNNHRTEEPASGPEKREDKTDKHSVGSGRYALLDEIRGISLISMLLYHGCWDLVYIFHIKAPWYQSRGAYFWQQSICLTFIFLSGFCWHLSRKKVRHGLLLFLCGAIITAVTLAFLPEDRVVFGILTFLGSACLIVILINNITKSLHPPLGFALSLALFAVTKESGSGFFGFPGLKTPSGKPLALQYPAAIYRNNITAFLGFHGKGFFSTDYFPIIPWIFLYLAGYYLYLWMQKKDRLDLCRRSIWPAAAVLGRHSLVLYMLHQPALYLLLTLVFAALGG